MSSSFYLKKKEKKRNPKARKISRLKRVTNSAVWGHLPRSRVSRVCASHCGWPLHAAINSNYQHSNWSHWTEVPKPPSCRLPSPSSRLHHSRKLRSPGIEITTTTNDPQSSVFIYTGRPRRRSECTEAPITMNAQRVGTTALRRGAQLIHPDDTRQRE